MPWKYNGNIIKEGRSWTNDDGITHPLNWAIWSDQEKEDAGLVWETPEEPVDSRYYLGRDESNNLISKDLEDSNAVDEEGNALLDMDGVTPLVNKGLKSVAIADTKHIAASLLQTTDWYITRHAETNAEIPANVSTYRASIREASNTIEAAILACTNIDDFIAIHEVPLDSDGNPTGEKSVINNWPDAI